MKTSLKLNTGTCLCIMLLCFSLTSCSAQNKSSKKSSEIFYRYGDSSVPPKYHRSYSITVTEEKVSIVVDSYGDILAEDSFDLAPGKMGELIKLAKDLKIRNTGNLKTSSDCTGGTTRRLTIIEKGRERVSGELYICGGTIYGTLRGDIDEFGQALKALIPGFNKMMQ
jgi:hypothetical protein